MRNDDINQDQFRLSMGIMPYNKKGGTNYVAYVNNQAKTRLAAFKQSISILDILQSVNRFKLNELPEGLRSLLIERVLYFRGQGMFFWDKVLEKYMFLPYAMTSEDNSGIDMYGQYQRVKPMTFNGKSENKNTLKKSVKEIYLGDITRVPVYDIEELEMIIASKGEDWCKDNVCIIIRDYTQGISEYTLPRSIAQEAWINAQSELPIFIRTAIFKALTPKLISVPDQGVLDSVEFEIQALEDAILAGKTIIPISSPIELKDIEESKNMAQLVETILKSYDSMNTLRLNQIGVSVDGAFQKQSGMNANEQTGSTAVNYVLEDGKQNRELGFEMVNRLWGLNISVEVVAETEAAEAVAEQQEEFKSGIDFGGDENEEAISD